MSKQTVLITGGAGSVGRAFVRHLADQYEVTVVDNNEWAVAELRQAFPTITIHLADFDHFRWRGNYVIHCAAYKHVNLGEENVSSFIQTNIIKTMRFYEGLQVDRLLYLSTDKAVEPISTYGLTKALAEDLTEARGWQVARCGNFLNSSGSVIPVWESQIKDGKPMTITDWLMVRYVSHLDEAIPELWQRFLHGQSLIIPTVRELTMAELVGEVLAKHDLEAAEYRPGFKLIGLRPGEKLREKLRWDDED